jgi:hypothetical protein
MHQPRTEARQGVYCGLGSDKRDYRRPAPSRSIINSDAQNTALAIACHVFTKNLCEHSIDACLAVAHQPNVSDLMRRMVKENLLKFDGRPAHFVGL